MHAKFGLISGWKIRYGRPRCRRDLIELVPVINRPGLEADHSPPYSVEVKNDEAIPPLPNTFSWRGA
jgi:hypothetical protein